MARTTRVLQTVFVCAALALSTSALATGEQTAQEAGAAAEVPATATETPVAETGAPPAAAADAGTTSAAGSTGAAGATVALARFTTAVENHEPVDAVTFLENDARRILFYTDLRNLAGQTVTHRWQLRGNVMAEVPFEVGSARWRVWSSKRLIPAWTGDWTVDVVKGDGEVIASETFTYQPKPNIP